VPNRKDPSVLNERELKFVANYEGDIRTAAKAAGYKPNSKYVYTLMQKPAIREAIKAKLAKVSEESGKKLARQIAKADVTARLLKLADIDPEFTNNNITGQVNALRALAEIEGYVIRKTEDVTKLAQGRSMAEMEYFAVHGYWPEQDNVQSSKPGIPGAETPDARVDKPN
jgi:hypothetical protein